MTESQLLGEITRLAGQLGLLAHHCGDPARCHGRGFPDLTIIGPGGVLFAEVKADRGRMTRDQWAWRYALLGFGPLVIHEVWKPADWESGLIERILGLLAREGWPRLTQARLR